MKELLIKLWSSLDRTTERDVSIYNAIEGLDKKNVVVKSLQTVLPISGTKQNVKDQDGNSSALGLSDVEAEVKGILTVGESRVSPVGTINSLGQAAGFTAYDRNETQGAIYSTYVLNNFWHLFRQGVTGQPAENIFSFNVFGYGVFLKGTVFANKTTAEINAITLPNTGLVFMNTTLNKLCFYNGTSWEQLTSTPM